MSTLLYVYGFLPSDSPPPPVDLKGVDDRPVIVLDVGPFSAAASELDDTEYRAGTLEGRLKDLGWVGRRGVEHERVVTWLADHATIVPMRLFTLFSSEAALRDTAVERAEEISTGLERFRDVREWDLKVSYDLATLREHLPELSKDTAAIQSEIDVAAPGRRYLLERKREDLIRREMPSVARALASALLDELRPLAERVSELEIPPHREGLPVVLDVALLVHRDRVEALRERATTRSEALLERGVHAALTGPWAPYRFVTEHEDA